MPVAGTDTKLVGATCHFLALRLARPELAHVALIGSDQTSPKSLPIRHLVQISTRDNAPNADIVADLSALPFRDHQFRGVVVDTRLVDITAPEHAEQLYRVLDERALMIFSGTAQSNRAATRNLFGLFRPRADWHTRAFKDLYATWPLDPPTPLNQLRAWAVGLHRFILPNTPQVLVLSKVTPPPPMPGLLQPVTTRVASAMPAPSLARARK